MSSKQVERLDGLQHIRIPVGQKYRSPGSAYVEGDASSASYFLAGATMTGMTLLAVCTTSAASARSLDGQSLGMRLCSVHRQHRCVPLQDHTMLTC